MDSLDDAPIVPLSLHNHPPMKNDEQIVLKIKIMASSFTELENQDEHILKEYFNDDTNSDSPITDDTVIKAQTLVENLESNEDSIENNGVMSPNNCDNRKNNEFSQSRRSSAETSHQIDDNIIIIKEEPQDDFLDEMEEEENDLDDTDEANFIHEPDSPLNPENVEMVVQPELSHFMRSCTTDNEPIIGSEKVYIKEEVIDGDYLSMTVDNGSDHNLDDDQDNDNVASNDGDDDNDGECESSNDEIVADTIIESPGHSDSDSSITVPISVKAELMDDVSNPDASSLLATEPVETSSNDSASNKLASVVAGRPMRRQTRSNTDSTTVDVTIPAGFVRKKRAYKPRKISQKSNPLKQLMLRPLKNKEDAKTAIVQPTTVQSQPDNSFIGLPSGVSNAPTQMPQFPAGSIVQFTPENIGNNGQGVQYFQLGQNGGLIQLPGQNLQNNPFGYFLPPQVLQMPQQQTVQGNLPATQNVQQPVSAAGQPVAAAAPQTLTVQQNGQVYQIVQNEPSDKVSAQNNQVATAQQTLTVQQNGQVYHIVPAGGQNKTNTHSLQAPQTASTITGPNGAVYQIVQGDPTNGPPAQSNAVPQVLPTLQHNGHTYQLANQNDQLQDKVSQNMLTVQHNGQLYQVMQNSDKGSAGHNNIQTVQHNGQIFQILPQNNDQNKNANTGVNLQQNGQLFQVVDSNKSAAKTVQTIQHNGQVYHIVQQDENKNVPVTTLQHNGQIYQVINNDQTKAQSVAAQPFPTVTQQNGSVLQMIQGNNNSTNKIICPTMQHTQQATFQVVQSEKGLDLNSSSSSKQSGRVYQLIQCGTGNKLPDLSKGPIYEVTTEKSGKKPVGRASTYQLILSPTDLAPVPKTLTNVKTGQTLKLIHDNRDKPNMSRKAFQQIAPSPQPASSRSPHQQPSSNVKKTTKNMNKTEISNQQQSITSTSNQVFQVVQPNVSQPNITNQILQMVQGGQDKMGATQNTNAPVLQFVQSRGQDKLIPQAMSSAGQIMQFMPTVQDTNVVQNIIGPNGQLYQVVQASSQNKVETTATSKEQSTNNQNVQQTEVKRPQPDNIQQPLITTVNGQVYHLLPDKESKVTSDGQVFQLVTSVDSNKDVPNTTPTAGKVYQLLQNNNFGIAVPQSNTNVSVTNSPLQITAATTTTPAVTSAISSANRSSPTIISGSNYMPILPSPRPTDGSAPKILSAKIRTNSGPDQVTSFMKVQAKLVKQTKQKIQQYKPIAPAPIVQMEIGAQLLLDKNESKGAAVGRAPSPITEVNCQVTPSEELPGLFDDVIYHDGKGYYYYFNKMKYKNKTTPNDQMLLRCVRDECRAVASITVGEKDGPIRHGLWYHNHDVLAQQEQVERRERLQALNRLRGNALNEEVDLQLMFKEEVARYKQAVRKVGFKKVAPLLADCICNSKDLEKRKPKEEGGARNFYDLLISKAVNKDEKFGTIAMSVKRRPRSTINTRPLIDNYEDNPANEDEEYVDQAEDDYYDDNDSNYSLQTVPKSSQPVKKRGRGRPRKKRRESEYEESTYIDTAPLTFAEIKIENIKSEIFDEMNVEEEPDEMVY